MDNRNHLLKEWYLEYAIGSVAHRMNICKASEFVNIVKENLGKEIYSSMFLYDESVKDFVDKEGTISRFKGMRYLDKIILDIDLKGESKGDDAIQTVLELVDELNGKGVGNEIINIWFSGRGFHIHLPNVYGFEPSENLDKIVRASIQRDFGKYVDLIYDATRLIRTGYSYNLKTKRYKNPFTINELELWDYERIKDMSKERRTDYFHPKFDYDNHRLLEPMDISRKNIKEVREVFKDSKAETSRFITCAQHIYNAGAPKGNRHHYLLRVISIAISKFGYDSAAVQGIAKAFNEKSEEPLPATEVSTLIASALKVGGYRYPCNDEILSKFCDPKCTLYRYRNLEENTEVMNAESMINFMLDYVNIDFSEKSFDLQNVFPFLPEPHLFKAGDLAILAGDTKLGKTAFFQHIVSNTPSIKTLFMSLEVDKATIIRRFMQQMLLKDKHTVNMLLQQKDVETLNVLNNMMSHLEVLTDSPDITRYSELIEQYKPKMLVIDTIDMVPARYAKNDEFEKMNYIIIELKKLAMQNDIILLGVSHISKGASRRLAEGNPMDIHDTKGNSVIEQKADKIISFEGERENYKIRRSRTLGYRDESTFHIVCNFDWETFTFKQRG